VPDWLAGTSAGEVLFQADYYLKELSMGDYEQPVLGMRSCLDYVKREGPTGAVCAAGEPKEVTGWNAREWFVVREAAVHLSTDGVLVPRVAMGVEAREQVAREDGCLEDKAVTRPDHPLVKYAEVFTEKFDLIAERRSVIYHLRELAKASILAKFLLEACICLDGSWFTMADEEMAPCFKEVPQLWNEHLCSRIRVRDGELVDEGPDSGASFYGLYGGVSFGLGKMQVYDRGTDQVLKAHLAAVASKRPRGVDLALDRFDLSRPVEGEWDTCISPDNAALALGSAFWANLSDGATSVLRNKDRALLSAVFNRHLSDRREEGDHFVPPDTSSEYMGKLQTLIDGEEEIRRKRIALFSSAAFSADDVGPLFPSSWTSLVRLDRQQRHEKTAATAAREGLLEARPDYKADRAAFDEVLRFASPAFNKSTEDGLRFRVYRVGSLEVRTLQESEGGEESISAVFSVRPSASSCKDAQGIAAQKITKATEYVQIDLKVDTAEEAAGGEAQPLLRHYYVVLETEQGALVLTERLKDGSVAWEVDPADLEDRCSMAKVIRSADSTSSQVTVGTIRSWSAKYQGGAEEWCAQSDRKRYAHHAFRRAAGERRIVPSQTWEGQWEQWWTADWGRQQLSATEAVPEAPPEDNTAGSDEPPSPKAKTPAGWQCGQCGVRCLGGPAADGRTYCNSCWWAWDETGGLPTAHAAARSLPEPSDEVLPASGGGGGRACAQCGGVCRDSRAAEDGRSYCDECWWAWGGQ
jgi:hypothetical protein